MTPDDLIEVADRCHDFWTAQLDADWGRIAPHVNWSCRDTLAHLCHLTYALDLATQSTERKQWALQSTHEASVDALATTAHGHALVLAAVARAMPSTARGYHTAGQADPEGFLAMAVDEFLVHTADIAAALQRPFEPSNTLARKVLDRLFPWWPTGNDPWRALLWANGRGELPGHSNPSDSWLWHCRPLAEWDGTVPRWDPAAAAPTRET